MAVDLNSVNMLKKVEKEYWRRDVVVPGGIVNIIKHSSADEL